YTSNPINSILAPAQHTVFYAVAQAVFLIFCFRWRDLMVENVVGDDLEFELDLDDLSSPGQRPLSNVGIKDKWIPELSILKRVITSVLNPLRECSQNVVMQFARIAQATDFVYCYTVLETNKRGDGDHHSTASSSTARSTYLRPEAINKDLNTFFPFDPYRLPKSSRFIQEVYREWSSVELEVDDDDEEEEDEEEDDESSYALPSSSPRADGHRYLDIPGPNKRKGPSIDDDDGGLGQSLVSMSISPIHVSVSVDMR
ncbi:hypothetical protein CVT24_006862, partial [Panaeolus cyanescens]